MHRPLGRLITCYHSTIVIPQRSARRQYQLLAIVTALSLFFVLNGATAIWDQVFHGSTAVHYPFQLGTHLDQASTPYPEALAAGIYDGAKILSINGKPFTGFRVFIDAIRGSHPGQILSVGYLAQNGKDSIANIHLISTNASETLGWLHIVTQDILLRLLLPLCCLVLGCWVVIAKPHDLNAWFLLGIFNYFPTVLYPSIYWPGIALFINPFWGGIVNSAGPLCIMLFGIYFPERATWDQRRPG